MNRRRAAWGSLSRRSACDSRCSRRPCRSPGRCGPPTTARIAASIISSNKPFASRSRCRVRTRRFWSAGGGEKKTLRLVAQYADACNLFGTAETVRAKLEILKRHCETLGRDYRTIEITTLGTVDPQPGKTSSKDVIAQCKALASIGVQHAVFNMPTVHELAPIEQFRREIIPAVAGY